MISLKLTNIAPSKGKEASLEKGFLYKDVLLDFEDGYTYNNPTLTIFYSRGSSAGQRVSSSKRNAL